MAPAYTSITGFSVGALSETSVRFNWSAANTVDYVWYSTNNGSSWTGVDVADGTSGSFDVGGLAANTGYNFKIRVRRKDSQLTTDSGAYYATTYAYPYLTSVPEFTVGNSLNISIYNPLGRSCTISLIGDNGVEHNGDTITGTTISPFNNDSWKNIWYSTLPSKTQGTYKARLVCSTGNVNQVSSAVKYYLDTSDSGFKPAFTANEIINVVNTANTAIAGSNKFIKNHNSLSGVIKPMTAKRSARGSYYNVSTSGLSTVKKDYSSSNINFVLGNMSTNTFNVTAVDSRGFTTTVSKTIDLVDYNNPGVMTSKITRQNGIGTKAVLAFTGVYTNWTGLLKTNSIKSIRYKIGASGTWKSLPSNATLTSSNGVWTLNAVLDDTFATTSQYYLYLEIKDLLETVVVGAYTISTADAFIWKDLANKRIGINKKPTEALDVAGNVKASGNMTATKFIGTCSNSEKLTTLDTRDVNSTPAEYMGSGRGFKYEFKNNKTIGNPLADTYSGLLTITPWGNSSGGRPTQIAVNVKGFKYRHSSDDTTWGSWFDFGLLAYPVGSIYISANETNPGTLFGGTWEQIKDRFLLACGDAYINGKTGGRANHKHPTSEHTLTVEEMPSHAHSLMNYNSAGDESGYKFVPNIGGGSKGYYNMGTAKNGGNKPHSHGDTGSANHMPPYLAVYVWKRTA